MHTTAIMDCHSGECAWPMAEPYGPFQPAVSITQSYGKMVPPTTPYGKTIPPRASTAHLSTHRPRDPHFLCSWPRQSWPGLDDIISRIEPMNEERRGAAANAASHQAHKQAAPLAVAARYIS